MRRSIVVIGVAIVLGLALTGAQQASGPTVQAAQSDEYGSYLTDAEGRTLYLFTKDTENTSNCYDQCAENWPPLVVEGAPTAGKGVAGSLLGTTQRKDGSSQVTYNGHPLYTFAKDQAPGDTMGQGVGDVWFLVSPYGVAIEPKEQAPKQQATAQTGGAEVDAMTLSALQGEGRKVFADNCAVCHGRNGQGGRGPALAGNNDLSDQKHVIRQIVQGGQFMPPFGDVLSERQVAAVATYIRTTWGNDFGAVTEEEVNAVK